MNLSLINFLHSKILEFYSYWLLALNCQKQTQKTRLRNLPRKIEPSWCSPSFYPSAQSCNLLQSNCTVKWQSGRPSALKSTLQYVLYLVPWTYRRFLSEGQARISASMDSSRALVQYSIVTERRAQQATADCRRRSGAISEVSAISQSNHDGLEGRQNGSWIPCTVWQDFAWLPWCDCFWMRSVMPEMYYIVALFCSF